MKRAGGGFDLQFKAQTAVDEATHILVAAEILNTNSDVQQPPMVLSAIKEHTGSSAVQVLAELAKNPTRIPNRSLPWGAKAKY